MPDYQVTAELTIWYMHLPGVTGAIDRYLRDACYQAKETGYSGIEGILADWKEEPKAREVKALLIQTGLSCPSIYDHGIYHQESKAEETISRQVEEGRMLHDILGVTTFLADPHLTDNQRKSDEELAIECRYLEILRQELGRFGMSVAINNHTPHGRDDARELRVIAAHTRVDFGLDPDWLLDAGVDPVAFTREYADRVSLLHLRNTEGGVWMEVLDDGEIDYRSIASILADHPRPRLLVVELAYKKETRVTRSIAANLKLSREYVREVFGV